MFEMLLGHLVGDYLLQNDWMALNKTKNNITGWVAAIVHCLIYTLAVTVLMWEFNIYWIIAVFFSHFFIDKFSLAKYYLFYVKGKSFKEIFELSDNVKINKNHIISGSFTTL